MILREYEENGFKITEYTRDGQTVSARVEVKILTDEDVPPPVIIEQSEPQPTIEEKILAENQYQTMLLELTNIGGM